MTISDALRQIDNIEFRLLPIERLYHLKQDFERRTFSGIAGQFIEENYMNYCFEIPKEYRSILIVSYPQPHAQFGIESENGIDIEYYTVPSGYYNDDLSIRTHNAIETELSKLGITAKRVHLPLKLLGARSGLTKYGKNHIGYAKKQGSQHRLVAYFTSVESQSEVWEEDVHMAQCKLCNACVDSCPYGAILDDRFTFDPNKCLSFYLDLMNPLPSLFHISSIKAIIGCTKCQDCCSFNSHYSERRIETLAIISKSQIEEFKIIESFENLTHEAQLIVNVLGFKNGYELFRRNLGLLTMYHGDKE